MFHLNLFMILKHQNFHKCNFRFLQTTKEDLFWIALYSCISQEPTRWWQCSQITCKLSHQLSWKPVVQGKGSKCSIWRRRIWWKWDSDFLFCGASIVVYYQGLCICINESSRRCYELSIKSERSKARRVYRFIFFRVTLFSKSLYTCRFEVHVWVRICWTKMEKKNLNIVSRRMRNDFSYWGNTEPYKAIKYSTLSLPAA